MNKPSRGCTRLTQMCGDVIVLLADTTVHWNFDSAFMEVAHKNNIFYKDNKECYNYHSRAVRNRIKSRLGKNESLWRENAQLYLQKKSSGKRNAACAITTPRGQAVDFKMLAAADDTFKGD